MWAACTATVDPTTARKQKTAGTFLRNAAPSHEAGAWCVQLAGGEKRGEWGRSGGVGLGDAIKRAGEVMASWRIIERWWHYRAD